MEEKEILKLALIELRKRGIIKTQKELAELAGVTASSLSLAMNGKMTSRNILQTVNTKVGNIFNRAWILTGEGDMLATPPAETQNFVFGHGQQVQHGDIYNGADARDLEMERTRAQRLELENEELKRLLAEKDKEIARLEGKIEIYREMLGK